MSDYGRMDQRQLQDLDRHITGNWGEDSVEDETLDIEPKREYPHGWFWFSVTAVFISVIAYWVLTIFFKGT